jgi:hypothetical protein
MAFSYVIKEAIWLHALFANLDLLTEGPTPILGDNQSAIIFSHNSQFYVRSKHIDIWYYFICKCIIFNEITVTHCTSEDNQTDLFTKALSCPMHERQLVQIGLRFC